MPESEGHEIAVKNIVAGLQRVEVWVREMHHALANMDPEQTIRVAPRAAAANTPAVSGGNCPPGRVTKKVKPTPKGPKKGATKKKR